MDKYSSIKTTLLTIVAIAEKVITELTLTFAFALVMAFCLPIFFFAYHSFFK